MVNKSIKSNIFALMLLITILGSCNSNENSKNKAFSESATILSEKPQKGSSIFHQDTILINGAKYIEIRKKHDFFSLVTPNGDIVIKPEEYYFDIEYLDIDEDGYIDIRVSIFSNTPNQCDNYFYDKNLKKFHKIANSNLDIRKIKKTNCFYSYNSIGCGDLSWESHLVVIQDWTEIPIGLMQAKGCGDEDDKIEIFKLANNNEQNPIKTMPIIKFDSINHKWDFIQKYWSKNFMIFE